MLGIGNWKKIKQFKYIFFLHTVVSGRPTHVNTECTVVTNGYRPTWALSHAKGEGVF